MLYSVANVKVAVNERECERGEGEYVHRRKKSTTACMYNIVYTVWYTYSIYNTICSLLHLLLSSSPLLTSSPHLLSSISSHVYETSEHAD